MEVINNLWVWIVSSIGGVSVTTILVMIIKNAISSAISKGVAKLALKQLYDEAVNKSIESVKEISFSQSIQPIVNSELEKINEKVDERLNKTLKEIQLQNNNIILIIKSFASYFDDSFMISNEKREELKLLIETSQKQKEIKQEIKIVEIDKSIVDKKDNKVETENNVIR